MTDHPVRPREPILNVPAVVSALIVVLTAIHAMRVFLLTPRQDADVILIFSFIPIRYQAAAHGVSFPGGGAAEVWSPLTYGLLHGDFTHLAVNAVWMAAFGSALARRFGTARFLAFSAAATLAGAAAHYAAHPLDTVPMVGASAAISGHMAAVARFMFQGRGAVFGPSAGARPVPALSLGGVLRDRRALVFLGVWFALNLLFGLGAAPLMEADASIAWEAHVGGFIFGLLAFPLFDPPATANPAPEPPPGDPSNDPAGPT